jgi:hypothetical protein
MWRLSPLTGWVKKHSGSSGQLAGVHLPQGRPGRASHQAPQGVGERARHSSHRSVHGADAEVPGERQRSVRGWFVIRERLFQPR